LLVLALGVGTLKRSTAIPDAAFESVRGREDVATSPEPRFASARVLGRGDEKIWLVGLGCK